MCTLIFTEFSAPRLIEVLPMSKLPTLPEVGRVVVVTRGRDNGMVAVVVRQEAERFVYLADGFKRTALQPKKKNVLHVRSTSHISPAVHDEVLQSGKVSDTLLRDAVNAYNVSQQAVNEGIEERVGPSGER
jgi:large subunit ribosomal protein L14e